MTGNVIGRLKQYNQHGGRHHSQLYEEIGSGRFLTVEHRRVSTGVDPGQNEHKRRVNSREIPTMAPSGRSPALLGARLGVHRVLAAEVQTERAHAADNRS